MSGWHDQNGMWMTPELRGKLILRLLRMAQDLECEDAKMVSANVEHQTMDLSSHGHYGQKVVTGPSLITMELYGTQGRMKIELDGPI